MSEKDVKDNETEALNNAAAENAENADIEAGETDMATSIESVDFAVVYDDGGDSIATESAENAENTEGIATEDSVASDNANRVNETLALGATDDEQSLDQHETVQADSATSVSSQIDREIKHHRKKDAFFFKANPTAIWCCVVPRMVRTTMPLPWPKRWRISRLPRLPDQASMV